MKLRGLYAIADAASGDPEQLARAMLAGGCRWIQLRAKELDRDALRSLTLSLLPLCQAAGARLILNDHADLAAETGVHGVHVGQTDASSAEVRRVLRPGQLLGRSTNRLDQLPAAVSGADYVAFGPIFSTTHLSRPKQVQGVEALRAARALVPTDVPLVAIGGITAARLPQIRPYADAWAVIGAIAESPDPVAATRALC